MVAVAKRSSSAASPIVKWVGGKTKLLEELITRAPGTYRRYFEPFVGGGALFFRISPRSAHLSDLNHELIACYRTVQRDVEAVIRALDRHRSVHSVDHYYTVRSQWNDGGFGDAAARAAAFLYMNKTCYNGLWRVNSRGKFNVPAGRYERPSILDPDALRSAASALAGATLAVAPFEAVLADAREGDFVYFDPPYDPVSATAYFTSYTSERFGTVDQARLAAVVRELDGRGCAVMVSNSDTPLVRSLYAGLEIAQVRCPRAINSKAEGRGAVAEVIVRNRY